MVLEKTLENLLNGKDIKPINPNGNQPWIFIGRTVAEAPILWSHDLKSQLTGKSLMLGKIKDKRKSGWQLIRRLDNNTISEVMNLSKLQETVEDRPAWLLQSPGSQRVGQHLATAQQQRGYNTYIGVFIRCIIFHFIPWIISQVLLINYSFQIFFHENLSVRYILYVNWNLLPIIFLENSFLWNLCVWSCYIVCVYSFL